MKGKVISMSIITISATELQNNFEKYLDLVMNGQQIIVTVNNKEIGCFIPKESDTYYLSDSLVGIIKGDYKLDEEKTKSISKKYGPLERSKQ